MPPPIRIKFLEPRHDLEGRVLYFIIGKPDRRAPPDYLGPEQVPEPEKGAGGSSASGPGSAGG